MEEERKTIRTFTQKLKRFNPSSKTKGKKAEHTKHGIITRILAACFVVVMAFSMIPVSSSAKNYKRTKDAIGINMMNPTASELRSLSDGDVMKYVSDSRAIRISEPYSFSAYKYTERGLHSHEGPHLTYGWYSIYSTGKSDTIGELYKTYFNMKGWPWNWHYDTKSIIKNDDSDKGRNFHILYKMYEGETIYIASRLYYTGTGDYEIHVEPNNDPTVSELGGYWAVDNDGKCNVGGYYSYDVTESKLYLTKEQVATMYEVFRQMIADAVISKERVNNYLITNGYPATVLKIYSLVGDALISFAPGWVQSLAKCGEVMSEVLSPVFADALDLFIGSPEEFADICIKLEDVCGASYDAGNVTAENGVVITHKKEKFFGSLIDNYEYEVYNSTTLYGSDYEKGTWTYFNEDEAYEYYFNS